MSRDKATVAAVLRRNKTNCRIVADSCGQKRLIRHERIVLRSDHQEGHTNFRCDAFGSYVLVVMLCVTITELRRGDDIVKLAHGVDWPKGAVELVALRKHFLLAGVAVHQSGDEAALVQIILCALQSICAGGKIQRRTHGADAAKYAGAASANSPAIFVTRFPPIE